MNTEKLDFSKIKNFCLNNTVKRLKKQATNWDKMSTNYLPDKGFVSSTYEELSNLNKTKQTN